MRLACSGGACGHVHAGIGGACVTCIACIVEHALVCIVAFCGVALCYVFLCVDVAVFLFCFCCCLVSVCTLHCACTARGTMHAWQAPRCGDNTRGTPPHRESSICIYIVSERGRYYRTS